MMYWHMITCDGNQQKIRWRVSGYARLLCHSSLCTLSTNRLAFACLCAWYLSMTWRWLRFLGWCWKGEGLFATSRDTQHSKRIGEWPCFFFDLINKKAYFNNYYYSHFALIVSNFYKYLISEQQSNVSSLSHKPLVYRVSTIVEQNANNPTKQTSVFKYSDISSTNDKYIFVSPLPDSSWFYLSAFGDVSPPHG